MADSTSPLVKGLKDPMKAATEAADRAAYALEGMTAEAHRTLPPRPSMAASETERRSSGQETNEPAQPLRQLASVTIKETQATRKVLDQILTTLRRAPRCPDPQHHHPHSQSQHRT